MKRIHAIGQGSFIGGALGLCIFLASGGGCVVSVRPADTAAFYSGGRWGKIARHSGNVQTEHWKFTITGLRIKISRMLWIAKQYSNRCVVGLLIERTQETKKNCTLQKWTWTLSRCYVWARRQYVFRPLHSHESQQVSILLHGHTDSARSRPRKRWLNWQRKVRLPRTTHTSRIPTQTDWPRTDLVGDHWFIELEELELPERAVEPSTRRQCNALSLVMSERNDGLNTLMVDAQIEWNYLCCLWMNHVFAFNSLLPFHFGYHMQLWLTFVVFGRIESKRFFYESHSSNFQWRLFFAIVFRTVWISGCWRSDKSLNIVSIISCSCCALHC